MNLSILSALVVLIAIHEAAGARKTLLTVSGNWCQHRHSVITTGDFDGDGLTDLLCYDNLGRHWIRYAEVFRADEYLANMKGWCRHRGSKRYIGDFNGDGRHDLLCHDTNGHAWIRTADRSGTFTGESWHKPKAWCNHVEGELHVADFNGDGRSDLLCHNTKNGHKMVALAAERHFFESGTSWQHAMGWCHSPAQLFVGYFNDDKMADILCHGSNGAKWIAYSHMDTYYQGFKQAWYNNMRWCAHRGSMLSVADIDFNGRDDIICHDNNGATWTALNKGNDHFVGDTSPHFYYCKGRTDRFLTGNFIGDGRKELICTVSKTWIIKYNLAH